MKFLLFGILFSNYCIAYDKEVNSCLGQKGKSSLSYYCLSDSIHIGMITMLRNHEVYVKPYFVYYKYQPQFVDGLFKTGLVFDI